MDGPKSLEYYLQLYKRKHVPPSSFRCPRREQQIINEYINSWPPNWKQIVENHAMKLPALKSTIRIIGLIPARNEKFRIQKCINAISTDVKSSKMDNFFELIILDNGTSEEIGHLNTIIKEWRRDYTSLFSMHLLEHKWNIAEKYPIAKARKLLADIAIFRIHRANLGHPTYLLSEDADIERIQSGRLKAAMKRLDNYPFIDALRGGQERSLRAMQKNNLALIERRSWQITELLLSSSHFWPPNYSNYNFYWNRVVTAGSNVFISSEVYCLIGGYSEDITIFEDMDIGQRISVLRGGYYKNKFIPRMNTVTRFSWREESSIARVLLALIKMKHLYNHDGSEFFDNDHIIKSPYAVDNLLIKLKQYERLNKGNKYRFEQVLSDLYMELHRIGNIRDLSDKVFIRMMYFLGIPKHCYLIREIGYVVLTNISYIQNVLNLKALKNIK